MLGRQVLVTAIWLASGWGFAAVSVAQDSVIHQASKNEPPRTREGQIIDFNAKFLTLKLEKTERKIVTDQVRRFETKRLPSHLQANVQKRENHFQAAIRLYQQALLDEPRPWMQREIRASIVECLRESGQWIEAGKQFEELMELESESRFFHVIPMVWMPQPPNAGVVAAAGKWLDGDSERLALIASSLLLSAADRAKAVTRLQDLAQSRDSRIAQLASMQVWRARAITAKTSEIKSWKTRIEKIPERYRAGGYYLIGVAEAREENERVAATTLLRIPILYSGHHQLSASALHQAAKLLKKTDPAGATQLYRELASQYADTPMGQDAVTILRQQSSTRPGNGPLKPDRN